MYSFDTDAHNNVNSHVLRKITYVTCQTSHTYNTLCVLFSNLILFFKPYQIICIHYKSGIATAIRSL